MKSKVIRKVLILSLEGIESNTETNFFNGLFHHSPNGCIGKCKALGKLGPKTKMKARYKNRLSLLIREIDNFLDQVWIFFIGDGQPLEDITSMERARDFIIEYFEEKKFANVNFHKEIIYDQNKSFEDILNANNEIKESKVFAKDKQKKKSNHGLFNYIIEKIEPRMKQNEKGDLKSILFKLFDKSSFKKIIDFIYN